MRQITLQVFDPNDKLIYSRDSVSACNNNCLEQNAVGFARMLKAYFNDPSISGFPKIAGLGFASPHTVVVYFPDDKAVQHYEDVEIDALPEYVTREYIEACILKRSKTIEYKGV